MVDAGERRPDEAKPPEKGDRVKSAPIIALPLWLHKTDSLRAQQEVARYGKAARHPLCLAALDLLRLDDELLKCTEEIELPEELVKCFKQMKEKAQALIKQFHKKRNEKKANQISALLREIDSRLLKAQTRYELLVKLRSAWQETRPVPQALFKRKYERVIRTGDTKARRALQRLRKRWIANEAALKAGDRRKLETLNMLRNKVANAERAKGEACAGYWVGGQALSDEVWEGRLTAREIHSRLVDAGVFSRSAAKERGQLHEIRRLARKLGLRLAEDQRGRKLKPYAAKQEPKRPHGRPRIKPDVGFTDNLEVVEAVKVATATGKTPVRGADH